MMWCSLSPSFIMLGQFVALRGSSGNVRFHDHELSIAREASMLEVPVQLQEAQLQDRNPKSMRRQRAYTSVVVHRNFASFRES